MPQNGQINVKEHYYDWYKHRNNLCCYNRLILEDTTLITEKRIMEWKTDEVRSYESFNYYITVAYQPNGHISVDLPSIRRRNSTWKVGGNYIDFERRLHVKIMTSIRRGYFTIDSTFKIDEISMSSPRGFVYVVSTSNGRNFCTRFFHSIIF